MVTLRFFLILILAAGVIAWVGDWLGRFIGRRRLTLFNLRPRYTAILITVFSGTLIALVTVGALLALSENMRIALFGLEELRGDVSQKGQELKNLRLTYEKEIQIKTAQRQKLGEDLLKAKREFEKISADLNLALANLRREKGRLGQEVENLKKAVFRLSTSVVLARGGEILFRVNEPLITTQVAGGLTPAAIEAKLKEFLTLADQKVRPANQPAAKKFILIPPDEFDEAVEYLKRRNGPTIVRLLAARNAVAGETVPVHFELFGNVLLYSRGEVISTALIDGTHPQSEIEVKIKELLNHVHAIAKSKGVLPDPAGSVGTISYAKIFAAAKEIRSLNRMAKILAAASRDTYTVGPLDIELKVSSANGT